MQQTPSERIARHYRALIETGALVPGMRLPTTREMAAEWDVSRSTIIKALAVLQRQGLVVTQGRRGVLVAEPDAVSDALRNPQLLAAVDSPSLQLTEALGLPRGTSFLVIALGDGGEAPVQQGPQPRQDPHAGQAD